MAAGERTPTRSKSSDRITLGSHGNSAFQPITASCKIVPQGQPPSPAESPGKSFQPITMSCKIVSGERKHITVSLHASICVFWSYFVVVTLCQVFCTVCSLPLTLIRHCCRHPKCRFLFFSRLSCNLPEGVNSVRHILAFL